MAKHPGETALTMVALCRELWFNVRMDKASAIELLGGTITAAAEAIGVTYQAVDKWPDPLPPRVADRVYAYLWRREKGVVGESLPEPEARAA